MLLYRLLKKVFGYIDEVGKATEDLFMEVWKEKYYEKDNNTIMVHIRHLREKMNDIGREPKYIKTIWGVGYKIENGN